MFTKDTRIKREKFFTDLAVEKVEQGKKVNVVIAYHTDNDGVYSAWNILDPIYRLFTEPEFDICFNVVARTIDYKNGFEDWLATALKKADLTMEELDALFIVDYSFKYVVDIAYLEGLQEKGIYVEWWDHHQDSLKLCHNYIHRNGFPSVPIPGLRVNGIGACGLIAIMNRLTESGSEYEDYPVVQYWWELAPYAFLKDDSIQTEIDYMNYVSDYWDECTPYGKTSHSFARLMFDLDVDPATIAVAMYDVFCCVDSLSPEYKVLKSYVEQEDKKWVDPLYNNGGDKDSVKFGPLYFLRYSNYKRDVMNEVIYNEVVLPHLQVGKLVISIEDRMFLEHLKTYGEIWRLVQKDDNGCEPGWEQEYIFITVPAIGAHYGFSSRSFLTDLHEVDFGHVWAQTNVYDGNEFVETEKGQMVPSEPVYRQSCYSNGTPISGFDVSKLMASISVNGGGHRHAAGANGPKSQAPLLLDLTCKDARMYVEKISSYKSWWDKKEAARKAAAAAKKDNKKENTK